ncbi:MAG: NUDIX domain-containing protein [Bacilli bacterium]|nr:NUDIX domain-containing protein [Bacilli bacterium]
MNEKEPRDYVKRIRKYLGNQKIILNSAGGVIEKDGKILLQRRSDNGKWGLIGGLLEVNETYLEAATREVKEETGLIVRPTRFLGIFHNHNMVWANGDQAHVIGAFYAFEIIEGEPRVDEESFELRFFAQEEIPYLFAEDHREAVKAFFDGVNLPIINENVQSQ